MKLFLVSVLVAFVIGLNFYMLSKVMSNSKDMREFDRTISIKYK